MSKTLPTVAWLGVLACLSLSQVKAAEQHEYFFVIAEGTSPEVRLALGGKLQQLIGSELVPDSLVHVLKAPSYQTLATFKVPRGSRNSRLKNRRLSSAWQGVLPFLKSPETKGSNQVDLPRLPGKLQELRQSEFPLRVVIAGSLIYDDSRHPLWKFNPRVPSDSCLEVDYCPFRGGVSNFPVGTKISWIAPTADLALDQIFVERVKRFYRLFCDLHGGEIVRLGDNPVSAFQFDRKQFSRKPTLQKGGTAMLDPRIETVVLPPPVTFPVENPRKETKLEPVERVNSPQQEIRSAEIPLDLVLPHSIPGDISNIAVVIDYSESMVKDTEKQVAMTWKRDRFLADACQSIRSLNFKKFAVIGFYGEPIDEETMEPRFHFFRRMYSSPLWADGSPENREAACQAIVKWRCRGGTPTLEALQMASRLEGLTTILLYTDGLPGTSAIEVQQYVGELAAAGITVHTVGIGPLPAPPNSNSLYNEKGAAFMLETARAGGGRYFGI